jgi:hypothetical protein
MVRHHQSNCGEQVDKQTDGADAGISKQSRSLARVVVHEKQLRFDGGIASGCSQGFARSMERALTVGLIEASAFMQGLSGPTP